MATMEKRKLSRESRYYKKCIVCNKRRIPGSNVHLSRIPLDPGRCRLWIKAIGQEELLDLPIEKLHELKFVCNSHFQPEQFNESAKRLVKHAVPTLNLPLPPLQDKQFSNFPLHIGQYPSHGFKDGQNDAPPCKIKKPNEEPEHKTNPVQNLTEEQTENSQGTDLWDQNPSHSDEPERDPVPEPDPEPEPGPFSWQESLPICVVRDDILSDTSQSATNKDEENKSNIINPATVTPSKVKEDEEIYVSEKHAEFSCDCCLGEIIGFRYTCVQCDNFDLCRACESQLVHAHHYMLRVPRPRPFNEIRSVVAAIRVKLKLLEDAFKQNSCEWDEIMIKKEEDPLEVETTLPQDFTMDNSEESVVPFADINDTQTANKQDSSLPSRDIQNKPSHQSTSTSMFQSYKQKRTVGSQKPIILNNILYHDAISVQKDMVSSTKLESSRRTYVAKTNVKLKQNIISNSDLGSCKESKGVSNESVSLSNQSASTNLKQILPKSDVIQYFKKDRTTSNIKKKSLQDTAMKNDVNLQQADSKTNNLQANSDSNTNKMFEEFGDEIWLDESVL